MAGIQRKVVKQGKRNAASRAFHSKNDKDVIAAWKQDLNRILHVFNVCSGGHAWRSLTAIFQTELAINTHTLVADIHRNALAGQEGPVGGRLPVRTASCSQKHTADCLLDSSKVSDCEN